MRSPLLRAADFALSFILISLLVTLVLRLVPDAVVRWRDALMGGAFTGALFTIGKLLIGYYLASRDLNDVYGAVGSLAVAPPLELLQRDDVPAGCGVHATLGLPAR